MFTRFANRRNRQATVRRSRVMGFEQCEGRLMLAGADVNDDGFVRPNDVAIVVNYILTCGSGDLGQTCESFQFPPNVTVSDLDVYGAGSNSPDGFISPADALFLINTLNIQPAASDGLAGGGTNTGTAVVRVTLAAKDLAGNVVSSIGTGEDFVLTATVEDLRGPSTTALRGVFAAYVDVSYDATKVAVAGAITQAAFPNVKAGNTATAGLLDEVGGMTNDILNNGPGPGPVVLFSAPLRSMATGQVSFVAAAPALQPLHSTLVFGLNDPVAVEFVGATLTVTPGSNKKPVANNDSGPPYATNEDTPLTIATPGILGNDTDPNGNPLTAVRVALPAHGSVYLNSDGSFIYTPDADFHGSDSFTYQANDGQAENNLSAVATVTIAVASVNDAPRFTKGDDQEATDEDGPLSIPNWATGIAPGPLTATDEVGQTLTFFVANDANELFSAQPAIDSSGKLTFTPKPNAVGMAQVAVVLKDNGGTAQGGVNTSGAKVFAITVTKANVGHNAVMPLDVSGDGDVAPGDALDVINFINAFGSQAVPGSEAGPMINSASNSALVSSQQAASDGTVGGRYYDVDADGHISPKDALDIINHINSFGNGEGEAGGILSAAANFSTAAASVDDLVGLLATDVAPRMKRRK